MDANELARLLGEVDLNTKDNPVFRNLPKFESFDPSYHAKQMDLPKIQRSLLDRIIPLCGYNPEIPVLEGSEEEMGGAKGRYTNLNGPERILIHRMYMRPGSKGESARYYLSCFGEDHRDHQISRLYQEPPSLMLSHLVEDILAHEYGHKVFHDLYPERIKTILLDESGFRYFGYLETFNEGFARWFCDTLVGHLHSGNEELVLLDNDYFRALKENTYRDRKGVYEVLQRLTALSVEQEPKDVLGRIPEIAVGWINEKEEQERIRLEAMFGSKYIITGPSTDKKCL